MNIISNGSKWAGEAPDSLEKLIEVLGVETLDPIHEDFGNFVQVDGDSVHVFGNFCTRSHVFNIRGTVDELRHVIDAIDAAKKRPDYIKARERLTASRDKEECGGKNRGKELRKFA